MKLRFDRVVVLVAVLGTCAGSAAQIPFVPAETAAQAAPTQQLTPQAQANDKWLMAYMLAHEGYRFDDVPMMVRAFDKMSPTQLNTLRGFYEHKHALEMQHAATMIQAQQNQATAAAASQHRQRPQQSFFLTPEQDAWQGAITNVRLQNMRNIADANEKGELFQIRQIPGLRTDPFGPTPMRAVGSGNWGERRDDLSPSAGAN